MTVHLLSSREPMLQVVRGVGRAWSANAWPPLLGSSNSPQAHEGKPMTGFGSDVFSYGDNLDAHPRWPDIGR